MTYPKIVSLTYFTHCCFSYRCRPCKSKCISLRFAWNVWFFVKKNRFVCNILCVLLWFAFIWCADMTRKWEEHNDKHWLNIIILDVFRQSWICSVIYLNIFSYLFQISYLDVFIHLFGHVWETVWIDNLFGSV